MPNSLARSFDDADLAGTYLCDVDLVHASIDGGVNLTDSSFVGVNLSAAYLAGANLTGVYISDGSDG